MNAFEGRRQSPDRLNSQEWARQQERAQTKQATQDKITAFKETIEESGIIEKITGVKDIVEGVLTSLGSGIQTALNILKTINAGKQPGWVQMALEYYANHPKTKLVILEKFGLKPSEQELTNGTAENLVKSIEDTAKKIFPNDPKALETLAKTLSGEGGIASLKDLQSKAQNYLVAQQKEKAKETAPVAQPATAPAAAASAPSPNPSSTPNPTPAPTTPPKAP